MIPVGTHKAVVQQVEVDGKMVWAQFGESKEKATKQVLLNLVLTEGALQGQTIGWYGYFTNTTYEKTLEQLRNVGWKGDDLSTAVDGPLNQEVEIVVEPEEYKGKTRTRVRWINTPGGSGAKMAKQMTGTDLRKFAASLKKAAKAIPEVAGKPRVEPPMENGFAREPGSDDGDEPRPNPWD